MGTTKTLDHRELGRNTHAGLKQLYENRNLYRVLFHHTSTLRDFLVPFSREWHYKIHQGASVAEERAIVIMETVGYNLQSPQVAVAPSDAGKSTPVYIEKHTFGTGN
jgi:hypothetical protein